MRCGQGKFPFMKLGCKKERARRPDLSGWRAPALMLLLSFRDGEGFLEVADSELVRAGFHDPLFRSQNVTGDDGQAGNGDVEGHPLAFPGLEGNALKGDQPLDRAQYRLVLTVRVHLDDLVPRPVPRVGHGDRNPKRVFRFGRLRHLEVFIAEAGVAQPVTEGEQGGVGSAGLPVVEGGQLADPLRPRGRQFAAGTDITEEDVRQCASPSVPGR